MFGGRALPYSCTHLACRCAHRRLRHRTAYAKAVCQKSNMTAVFAAQNADNCMSGTETHVVLQFWKAKDAPVAVSRRYESSKATQRQEYVPKRPTHASESHSFALNLEGHSLPGFVAQHLFVLASAEKSMRRMGCQPPARLEPTCPSKTCDDCTTAIEMIHIE